MAQLFWFHAFNRHHPKLDSDDDNEEPLTDEDAVVRVLREGPRPHPNPASETRQYEQRLNITPHRVYAYLGRTLEAFGDNAIVLPPNGLIGGQMSPFDTGGLINKIAPVSQLVDNEKCVYLAAFSFQLATEKGAVLERYPSTSAELVKHYLEAQRPHDGDGPHHHWPGGPQHPIWTSNTDWRAWTWEGRAEPEHFLVATLRHWTCSPSMHARIIDSAERRYGEDEAWLLRLAETYEEGGVGLLVERLKDEQAA